MSCKFQIYSGSNHELNGEATASSRSFLHYYKGVRFSPTWKMQESKLPRSSARERITELGYIITQAALAAK